MQATDTTPPVISYSISGTKGNGDWYVSNVFVDWTVTDPESAVTILEGCVDTTINYDTSGVTLTCRARSAGGTSQASVIIRRDATPPSVSVMPQRGPDHNGWYNKPVAFTVSGTDATSGLAGCAPGGTYTGPDSSSASFSVSCEDYAGNTGYGSHEFQYDATAPSISGSVSPAANDYGWNNTDVAVTFTLPNHPTCSIMEHDAQLPVCTMRHAPCDLRPAPCALHPAPCALHPAPCSLRPVPCTLRPAPCALHPAPCALHPAPCDMRPVRRQHERLHG